MSRDTVIRTLNGWKRSINGKSTRFGEKAARRLFAAVALSTLLCHVALAQPAVARWLVRHFPGTMIDDFVRYFASCAFLLACAAYVASLLIARRPTAMVPTASLQERFLARADTVIDCLAAADIGVYLVDTRNDNRIVASNPHMARMLSHDRDLAGVPHSFIAKLIGANVDRLLAGTAGEGSVVETMVQLDRCPECGTPHQDDYDEVETSTMLVKVALCRSCGHAHPVSSARIYEWYPAAAGDGLVLVFVFDVTESSSFLKKKRQERLFQRVRSLSSLIISHASDIVDFHEALTEYHQRITSTGWKRDDLESIKVLVSQYMERHCNTLEDWTNGRPCVPELVQQIKEYCEEFTEIEQQVEQEILATTREALTQ